MTFIRPDLQSAPREQQNRGGQGTSPSLATTRPGGQRRVRVSAVALLPLVGLATFLGASVASEAAGGAPVNLITNGSFENTTAPTTTYSTVLAGDSTTIQGWTVVTPSMYGPSGGSVDLTASTYDGWGAEDGNYAIDLAGTSSEPGGLYQDVATTPGVEYSLSYWTAVNGDQTPGQSHTMNVVVGGVTVATIQALSAGAPLQWVQQTTSVTATSSSTRVEFDDATTGDTIQGPALDNVSMTAIPDTITATSVTVAPQTTSKAFTAPVATFTDSYLGSPADFSASIAWGDTTTSAGTITQSGSTFTVSGTHTYAAHGTYAPTVSIASVAGASASVSDSVSVADAVTTCTGSGCSGTVSTPSQTEQISSTSTSGTVQTTIDPANNSYSCGDPFRHAPQVTTVTDTGLNANIVYTVTFANKAAAGSWIVPFAVCYQAQTPFKDLYGRTVTTGLLPLCTLLPRPGKPLVAPCVESITELPFYLGNVVEKIVLPAGDPRFH
jgi:choice-of-anchor C domain-containing protein